jgi:outer membrane lipoprotein-sorting protein
MIRRALVLLLLTACASAPVATGPAASPAAFEAQVRKAHEGPKTMSCDAKAFVQAPQNSGRYELHVSVARPDSLRIEALTPVGDPAAVLVATGGRFSLMDLRNNVFYRGPATARNLSRLLPVALRPEELVAVLTGGVPELPGAQAKSSSREGDATVLTFESAGAVQAVTLSSDLRVLQIQRTAGSGKLLWGIKLDQHDDATGLPLLFQFTAPDAKTQVDLRLRNLSTGKEPPKTAFELAVPNGSRVEEVR